VFFIETADADNSAEGGVVKHAILIGPKRIKPCKTTPIIRQGTEVTGSCKSYFVKLPMWVRISPFPLGPFRSRH